MMSKPEDEKSLGSTGSVPATVSSIGTSTLSSTPANSTTYRDEVPYPRKGSQVLSSGSFRRSLPATAIADLQSSFQSSFNSSEDDMRLIIEALELGDNEEGKNSVQKRDSLTRPIQPIKRLTNDLSKFTINKLNFSSLGVRGRKEEIKKMRHAFQHMIDNNNEVEATTNPEATRQLIVIAGESGTGKTKLASILKDNVAKAKGLYVRGKFDLHMRNQPYSAFALAVAEICGKILSIAIQDPDRSEEIIQNIQDELGMQLSMLMKVIPALSEVINWNENAERRLSFDDASSSKNKCNFAFLRLIRVLLKHFAPLVIVLDDLQWADASSLEFLDILLTERSLSQLAIVGIYRSNEVDKTHILHKTLDMLTTKANDDSLFGMLELTIGNLSVEASTEVVQEVLSFDTVSPELVAFGKLCFSKTQGNVFFLLRYIEALKDLDLLQYNFGLMSWQWDLEKIRNSTTVSDNVLDLLKIRMGELDSDLLYILKVAGCLGSVFDGQSVKWVWQKQKGSDDTGAVNNYLDFLADASYIVMISADENIDQEAYCWEHDQIHAAAISMMNDEERSSMCRLVAETLLAHSDESDFGSNKIFVIADLLNGVETEHVENAIARNELARLNYLASLRARRVAAFESAAAYAQKGIESLPEDCWTTHYDLSLKLYTIGAESEGFMGNTERMKKLCHAVLDRDQIPLSDKFGPYNTLIDSMMHNGAMEKARDLLFDLLKKLGIHFPKNPLVIIGRLLRDVVKTKRTMKKINVEMFTDAQDPLTLEIMRLLDKLSTSMYVLADDRLPNVIFKGLDISKSQGKTYFTPPLLATTGLVLTGVLNDLQGGHKYGRMAVEMSEQESMLKTRSRTAFCAHAFSSWNAPMRDNIKPLLEGYDLGLRLGDTESAMFNIFAYNLYRFVTGTSLKSVAADCAIYGKQMKALKRDQALVVIKPLQQSCLNLMGEGKNDDPTKMQGSALSETDIKSFQDHAAFHHHSLGNRGFLFTLFGRHVECADFFLKEGVDAWEKTNVAMFAHMWCTFLKGVSFYAAAQQTRKRKYIKVARRFKKRLINWEKQGNPNLYYYTTCLEGEEMWFRGKHREAIELLEGSIINAVRTGHLHDAALASERLSQFHRETNRFSEEAIFRLKEAVKFYAEWGAMAKVAQLERLLHEDDGQFSMPSELALPSRLSTSANSFAIEEI